MHLSLYRKFRPDTFDKIVRQEHVVRILRKQIELGAVGHAYLFCGPRGTGKTSVARIFARAVNCLSPKNGSPCGVCESCKALENSLDIMEIDAASNNGVNEMRELREKVQYPPVSARYKVYIVDEVHMLTDSAFNALLKTLEEPPAHVIFILATTEPQKIPATILSRCMRLDFKLIPEEDLETHLKGILKEIGKEYEEEAVAAIARAGAGSDRDMLSIAEACIVYSDTLTYETVCAVLGAADFETTAALVRAMLRSDAADAVERAEAILSEGKSAGVLARDLLECLNRVSLVKSCRNAERLLSLPSRLYGVVKEIADEADGRAVLRAIEIFIRTESELRFVSSPRISLEAAIARAACPAADVDVDALTVRVAKLEKTLKEGLPAPVPVSAPAAPVPAPVLVGAKPKEERKVEGSFSDWGDFEPVSAEIPAPAEGPAPAERPAPAKAPAKVEVAAREEGESAEVTFGKFLRALRRSSANGVLFTMCSDLVASYEKDTLILTTESDNIYASLCRENHRSMMEEAFKKVGVTAFEVRKAGKAPKPRDAVEELKKNFSDYPIEVK